jgi:DNA topoisomerase-1
MPKNLLIVESPAKAKTISKYLGSGFEVKASLGHIRDLPPKELGVDIEDGFCPKYQTIEGKQKIITELRKAAQGKDCVYLGPDPDREGEAIAWHIAQSLGQNSPEVKRVLLHELTPKAIQAALDRPVPISTNRFESQQTRRILDRLMGYLISPILWDKLKRGLSAGRVQSVALRLIVEREREIYAFEPEEYWSLSAVLYGQDDKESFAAALAKVGDKKAALKTKEETQEVIASLIGASFRIAALNQKERKRHALPPFTTSSLQQAAFHRLHLNPSRTMRLAQALYEGLELPGGTVGLITYMRTDSVRINDEAAKEAIDYAKERYGPAYAPESPNRYRNKKGAQDAHEAIRPTSTLRNPEELRGQIDPAHFQLYELIWSRFMASQMSPALYHQTTVDIEAGNCLFRATGSVLKFKGFLAAYDPGQDEDKNSLPDLEDGQALNLSKLDPKQHFTQPPPRFNEATLVKELEDKGIGRPSTYAAIITVLRDKEYVEGQKGALRPTEMGFAVTDLMVEFFPKLMDVDFTAGLEEDLDRIEEGQAERQLILEKLYLPLAENLQAARESMRNIKRDGLPVDNVCPKCHKAGTTSIRYGRNGFYLSCQECKATSDYVRDEKGHPQPVQDPTLKAEIDCELCGQPMVLKKGRYGAFLACSGYPDCRNTKPLKIEEGQAEAVVDTPPPIPEGVDMVCQKCHSPMVLKKTRHGNWFMACSNYPKCKNAKSLPSGIKCPSCGEDIVEKATKRGIFFGCSGYPKCRYILKGRPVPSPCPACGSPFRVENPKGGQEGEANLRCPNKECPSRAGEEPESPQRSSWAERKKAPATTAKTGPSRKAAPKKSDEAAGQSPPAKAKAPKRAAKKVANPA